jgi:uncharacterized protein
MSGDRPSTGWGRGAIAAVLLVVVSQLVYVAGELVRLAIGAGTAAWVRGGMACLVVGALGGGAIWLALRRLRRRGFAPTAFGFALPRRTLSSVGLFIGLTVLLAPVSIAVTSALGLHGSTEIDLTRRSQSATIFLSFAAVVVAPWFEEVSMRGLLLTALDRRFGFWPAAVVSALVWSGAHAVGGVLVIFAVEGVLLAWLRRRTGSILPGVALHGAWNALAVGASGAGSLGPILAAVLAGTVIGVGAAVRTRGTPVPAAAAG